MTFRLGNSVVYRTLKAWAKSAFSWITDSPLKGVIEQMKKDQPKLEAVMKSTAQIVRDHLPYSPAKRGPLMNLNKVRIVETIADTIKPAALIRKMQVVSQGVANAGFKGSTGTGGHGSVINLNFNLSGTATQADAKTMMAAAKKEFGTWLKQAGEQKARIAFAS